MTSCAASSNACTAVATRAPRPQTWMPSSPAKGLRPRFSAPMTLVVIPEECQSIPITVPNDWHTQHDLGYFYYQHKRYADAIDSLKKAVTLDPPAYVWHILAHSYEKSRALALAAVMAAAPYGSTTISPVMFG